MAKKNKKTIVIPLGTYIRAEDLPPQPIQQIKEVQKFTSSWLEYASQFYQQVIKNTSTLGTQTIYTVPTNMNLFITEIFVSISTGSITGGTIRLGVQNGETIAGGSSGISNTFSISQTMSKPLKITGGRVIQSISSTTGPNLHGLFCGFSGFLSPYTA